MKLVIPLAFMSIGSALCCCCGGSTFEDFENGNFEEMLENAAEAPAEGTEAPAEEGGAEQAAAGGSMAAGTCGKFKEWSLPSPSGFSVTSCVESGGNDSIVLSGSGSPSDACKGIRSWVKDSGFSIVADSDAMGSVGIVASKDAMNLAISCTDMMGSTIIAVSLSQ